MEREDKLEHDSDDPIDNRYQLLVTFTWQADSTVFFFCVSKKCQDTFLKLKLPRYFKL